MQSLLDKFNVDYEDLNAAEKETLDQWQKALAQKQLTLESVKDYLRSLIEAVEKELADVKESTSFWSYMFQHKKDTFLKARLKNYLMLYDFLSAPEKARKYIEQSIQNIK
jgi:uncharacterized coiled-coil protein SlyX